MPNQKKDDLVFTGSLHDAELVENILKDSGISTFVKNRNMGQIFPHFSPGGMHPVKIFVHVTDSEKAKDIIKTYFGGTM